MHSAHILASIHTHTNLHSHKTLVRYAKLKKMKIHVSYDRETQHKMHLKKKIKKKMKK